MMLFDEIKNSLTATSAVSDIEVYKISYEILCGIVEILRDDDTEDPECFMRIDRMVSLLNSHDIDTGARHDFG